MVKRILHIQGRMGLGGAETFMMNLYRGIDRSRYQFDFVIYEDYAHVRPYHEEIQALGGRIFVLPNPNRHLLSYCRALSQLFKKEEFAAIHNQIFFGGGLNLWLAKRAGIGKRLAHSHATSDGKGNKMPFALVRPFFTRLLMDNATDFLACSPEAGHALFGDHDFVFVPNGIPLKAYQGYNQSLERKKWGIPDQAFVLGHIGRMEDQKNHLRLLSIFQKLRTQNLNAFLVLVGKGSLSQVIADRIQSAGLQDACLIVPESREIPSLLASMDVFCMPSLYEGMPIVAMEAQAAGLKLVLADTIDPATKASDNVTFLSLDDSDLIWTQALLRAPFDNPPGPALQVFDQEQTIRLMEKIYDA